MENATIAHWIAYGQEQLASCSDSAKLDAQILLCFVLDKERSYLLTWPDKEVDRKSVV